MEVMSLYEKMKLGKFPVLASIPRNDLSLVRAALEGGADGFKVHLNVLHRASGNQFGNFSEEKSFLEEVSRLPGHKAIMIGEEVLASAEELQALGDLGFEAFDLYLKYAKPYLFESPLCPMLALGHGYSEDDLTQLQKYSECIVEASTVDPKKYGSAVEMEDLKNYQRISRETKQPVLVPSQRRIRAEELAHLREHGAGGVLLGVIVTGDTVDTITKSIQEFVQARNRFFS